MQSSYQQFVALLRKNYLVLIRSRKSACGLGGWVRLLIQTLWPSALLLLLLWLKTSVKPIEQQEFNQSEYPLGSIGWADYNYYNFDKLGNKPYIWGVIQEKQNEILSQVNLTKLEGHFLSHLSCGPSAPFDFSFKSGFQPAKPCQDSVEECTEMCWNKDRIEISGSLQGGVDKALEQPEREIGVIGFGARGNSQEEWTIIMRYNQTLIPSTRDVFSPSQKLFVPDDYDKYYNFVNMQQNIYLAVLQGKLNSDYPPEMNLQVRPYPWPEKTLDIVFQALSAVLQLILVISFIDPTRQAITTIVQEKELRLREGLLILGLGEWAYWTSWAATHFSIIALLSLGISLVCIGIFTYSNFFLVLFSFWLLSLALIPFAYCLSSLFSKANSAGGWSFLWFLIGVVPWVIVSNVYKEGSGWYVVAMLSPPSALYGFAVALVDLELMFLGLTPPSFDTSITQDYPFSISTIWGMLVLDIAIFSLLAYYLDKVMWKEYGQRLPWYFPIPALKNMFVRRAKVQSDTPLLTQTKKPSLQITTEDNNNYNSVTSQLQVQHEIVLQTVDLTKQFDDPQSGGKRIAVDSLDLQVRKSLVYGLLGHNGAGKTTAINMLVGMIQPDLGDAYINKHSIRTDTKAARQSLGVCPQFDVLWPNLTVREHLQLAAALKGFTARQAVAQLVEEHLKHVGLHEKINDLASDLSGGQRRKLSVALAFVGNPLLVVLDEPTSGMDPVARRMTWEVVQSKKEQCAIILTTHSMEEADQYSDCIGIMVDGSLVEEGSPMELKTKHGVGYCIIVTIPTANISRINAVFRDYYSNIEQSTKQLENGIQETTYKLQDDVGTSFHDLIRDLENMQTSDVIKGFAVNVTTLEDVFMKITSSQGFLSDSEDDDQSELINGPSTFTKTDGLGLFFIQFYGLFLKKLYISLRSWGQFAAFIFIPIIMGILAIVIARSALGNTNPHELVMNAENCLDGKPIVYSVSKNVTSNGQQENVDLFIQLWTNKYGAPQYLGFSDQRDVVDYFLKNWYSGEPTYGAFFIEQLPSPQQIRNNTSLPPSNQTDNAVLPSITLQFNQSAMHSLPALLNMVDNVMAEYIQNDDTPFNLKLVNYPLPVLDTEISQIVAETVTIGFLVPLFMCQALGTLAAFAVTTPVKERRDNSKHVQIVSGMKLSVYWLANWSVDAAFSLIPVTIIAIFFAAIPIYLYEPGQRLGTFVAALYICAFSQIPVAYLLSLLFTDETKASSRAGTVFRLAPWIAFMVIYVWTFVADITGEGSTSKFFRIMFQVIFAATLPQYNFLQVSAKVANWDETGSLGEWDLTGKYFFYMIVQGVVFFFVIYLIDIGIFKLFKRKQDNQTLASYPSNSGYNGQQLLPVSEYSSIQSTVQLSNVYKSYFQGRAQPYIHALKDVSFDVQTQECLGLLGSNGAGKTTAFKIVTREIEYDHGEVIVNGVRLDKSKRRITGVGYCPQLGGLPDGLSGYEVLMFYSRIKGIPHVIAQQEADKLMEQLQLTQYRKLRCDRYSGGNRRKLSVAVALLGSPKVVLMDEPTTGMDPLARRHLWKIIQDRVMGQGHSILLTSHSMEECEALCNRIVLLTHGVVRAQGTVQELKQSLGTGYILKVKCQEEKVEEVKNKIEHELRHVQLEESLGNSLTYKVITQSESDGNNSKTLLLSTIFQFLAEQQQNDLVVDYYVTQPSLEQMFLKVVSESMNQSTSYSLPSQQTVVSGSIG